MPKLKRKSEQQRRTQQRQLKSKEREDPVSRQIEQDVNTQSHRLTRQDTERRVSEQIYNTQYRRMVRQDSESRESEQKANTAAHQKARQDPKRREKEKNADNAAHQKARQDLQRRNIQQIANSAARSKARQNPERRRIEQNADSAAHQKARQNLQRRKIQQIVNSAAKSKARQIPERRQIEQKADSAAHQKVRQDSERREMEQKVNTAARRKARFDPERREQEQISNTQARRYRRKDDMRRQSERENETECRMKKRKTNHSLYDNLLQIYNEKIRRALSFICSSCGGLFYEEKTSLISAEKLRVLGCSGEFIKLVLHVNQQQHRLCTTCKIYVLKHQIPRLCLSNGFDYPIIPDELKDLSPLEERLVSLRLPFMQIRLVGPDRQSILRGNVVNVENDLDVVAQILPRSFNETSTIQVQLMRRMRYRSSEMYETIRPFKVQAAAKYLINTELYKSENVLLSEDWSLCGEDETMDFICSGNEDPVEQDQLNDIQSENGDNILLQNDDNQEFENEYLGAEETLVFRENGLSYTGIRIAPGEGNTPIPLHMDPNAELLSFPTIYGGIQRKFKNRHKVSYTDIAKSELRRYDRRACKPYKILYQFKRSFNEKVYQAIQICVRKKFGRTRVTAARVRDPKSIQNLLKQDEGYAVFKNIRASPAYWKEKTKKVLAMVRQVGKCTFFITLSAAETKWPELLVILMKIVKGKVITEEEASQLSFHEKAELIRSDPVTCMRHFDHRYRELLNLLLKKECGVFAPYNLGDYFSRYEYQMRGSPHVHGMFWIPEAPFYVEGNEDSEKACVEFIDQYITSERCEEGKMKNLIGYQLHKHSRTCEKKLQKGVKCRFGFPKPPMRETEIITPFPKDCDPKVRKQASKLFSKISDQLNEYGRSFKEDIEYSTFLDIIGTNHFDYLDAVRSSIKRTTIFVKRSTNAIFINPYNRKLLEAWEANIDVQFVLDTYACAKYCVGYILKSEGGVSRLLQSATLEAKKGNSPTRDKLKRYASILINGSEISAQEATSFLLSIPNTMCSRQDIYINTANPDERIGILKSSEELKELPDDSEDVCIPGILTHYAKRHEEQENICLAEFASLYEYTKAKKATTSVFEDTIQPYRNVRKTWELIDNSGYVRKRSVQKIIRFRHYSKIVDENNYYREQLMLFLPWRDETADLLSPDINLKMRAERFSAEILNNRKPYYWCQEVDDETLNAIVNEVDDEEELEHVVIETDLLPEDEFEVNHQNLMQGHSSNSTFEHFLPPRIIDPQEYAKLMRSLNDNQRRFVVDILFRLKTSITPFCVFLSGGAGVGKSHVITAIVQSYLKYNATLVSTNPEAICVLVSAPTGKAAFNVFGMTLHCTFKLPPTQYGGKVCDLDSSAVNTLRFKLAKTKVFIIDEISMVSVKQLYQIDQRLRQIFETTDDFGGKSIIVVGHLRQLSPIAGTYVFKTPSHLPLGECVGNYLWEKFKFFELGEIMRQKGELHFCRALNNMSEGCMDTEDIQLIKSREITDTNKPPLNTIRLFRTNEECRHYNAMVHAALATEGVMSTAFDRIQGTGSDFQILRLLEDAKKLTPQQSDGLPYKTHLQVGGEYFITTNIDVEDGLFNGSTGRIEIIDKRRNTANELIPTRVWIDFRNPLIGIKARNRFQHHIRMKNIPSNLVPVDRITKNLSKTGRHNGLQIIRKQIPVLAANGMTIAKAQGSSIPIVTVNVKPFHGRHLKREDLYVACSRATSLKGLFIDGEFVAPSAPGPDDAVTSELSKLRANPYVFTIRFLQDFNNNFEKFYYHNVQSLVAHHLDVIADQCTMSSNCVAFLEPHLFKNDRLTLPNFNILHRSNCVANRNSEGAVIFLKKHYRTNQSVVLSFKFIGPGKNCHCLFVTWIFSGINIILTYKSPTYSKNCFIKKLAEILNQVKGPRCLIGDINMQLKETSGQAFLNLMTENNLHSKINLMEPSTDSGTNIDICFSNVQPLQAWFYESYYSYHKPICVVWPKCL